MGNYGNLESMNLTQNPLRQNLQGHASVKNHKTLKFEDSQNRFKNFRKSVNTDPLYQNIEPRNKLQSHIAEMNQQISLQRPMTFHEKHKALSKLQNQTAKQQLQRLDQTLKQKVSDSYMIDKQERNLIKAQILKEINKAAEKKDKLMTNSKLLDD